MQRQGAGADPLTLRPALLRDSDRRDCSDFRPLSRTRPGRQRDRKYARRSVHCAFTWHEMAV